MVATSKKAPRNILTVGLILNEDTPAFLKYVDRLAIRLGAELRLIHALPQWENHLWSGYLPSEYLSADIGQFVEVRKIAQAREAIDAVIERVGLAAAFKVNIAFGRPAEVMRGDAVTNGSMMILCGRSANSSGLKGLSTSTTLMHDTPVPLMVVPQAASLKNLDFQNWVLADDLSADASMQGAWDLARQLRVEKVTHLHVFPLSRDELAGFPQYYLEAAAMGLISKAPQLSPDMIVEKTLMALEEKMRSCFSADDRARMRYHPEVLFGSPAEELIRYTAETSPDVVALGQHKAFHGETFSFGKMPVKTMQAIMRPILILPRS